MPWSADVALTAVTFYYAGHVTRRYDVQINNVPLTWKILTIAVLVAAVVLLLSIANGKSDMNYNHYGNMFFFYAAALSGIYLSYLIIQKVPYLRIVSYIGQNTIIIVGLAGVLSFVVSGFIYLLFHTLPSHAKLDFPMTIFYTLLEIGLLIPVIYMINRFTPFIIGRKRADKARFTNN
jgi:fucose 4-O-acetylase-like acetyltransferase